MQSLLKSRVDDLLSAEVGKHDYDWLLTPDSAHFPSGANGSHTSKAAPKIKANARSISTGKASRLSASQPEKDNSARKPVRSSSTSRSSLPTTHSSSAYLSNGSRTAALNTSTASVTSKPSPTASRSTVRSDPRPPTPTRTRPAATASNPAPPQSLRPCTPTARPRTPSSYSGSNAAPSRSNSRPSTPARRATTAAASAAPGLTRSTSVGHSPSTNSRTVDSRLAPRPSSPLPRGQAQAQASANARTKIQERDASALSPVVNRGRLQEKSSSARSNSKLNEAKVGENKKPTTAGNIASARSVSKIKPAADHTPPKEKEKKQGGNRGPHSLFPHSFRSTANGSKPARRSSQAVAEPHCS